MNEIPFKSPRTDRGLHLPILGVITLSFAAIIAQSAGLVSVVRYVTNREGWEAQKAQYAVVKSEWESMSVSTKAKIDDQRKQQLQIEQDRASAEKELEIVLQKLAKSKGELDTLQVAADSAEEVQKRAQSQEQTTLDNVQVLERQLSDLAKLKAELEVQTSSAKQAFEGLDAKISSNQTTLDGQNRELQANSVRLTQMDAALKTTRESLRKAGDDLVKANEDLSAALSAMRNATAETESAKNIKTEVDGLKSEKAKVSGEIEALLSQKLSLEKELSTADSRLVVANSRLAEYLEKWNNRENLNREIDELLNRVKGLKQTESDSVENISKLNEQSVQLVTSVKSLSDQVEASELQLAELRQKQRELIKELLELQKLKKQIEDNSGSADGDQTGDIDSND